MITGGLILGGIMLGIGGLTALSPLLKSTKWGKKLMAPKKGGG